jgi:hypothetical protein
MIRWISVAGIFACAGAAQASVPWSNPNGAGSFFTYSGGLSDNGLFGNPVLINDSFVFTPSGYQATTQNLQSLTVTDRLQVDLTANVGQKFTMIRIREFGGWSLTGVVGSSGSVQASGSLQIVDFGGHGVVGPAPLVTNPVMPITTLNTSGQWDGTALIDFTPILGAPFTHIRLVFSNTLGAASTQGASAHIDKKLVDGSVFVDVLPSPGSGAVLVLGGLLAARRRRA